MSKPIFSLIAPAVRSDFYKRFYDSVSYKNKIPFEVIFVGNKEPSVKMPDNFRYIHTNVKPCQCNEIAARNATGDYLIPVADDWTFSKRFLNKIHDYINEKSDDTFISFRFSIDGEMKDDWLYYRGAGRKKKRYIAMGIMGAFDRKLWHEIGGVDRRFIYNFCDEDMQLKFRQTKELFITPDCWIDEGRDAHKVQRRVSKIADRKVERQLFESFWIKDGKISSIRLDKNISFDDNDILVKSQGRNIPKIWD